MPSALLCSEVYVDAEIYDDAEMPIILNQVAEACSHCASDTEPLVALVRFSLAQTEVVLCGKCYRGLLEIALGCVV